ncbi:MAG: GNAT family N-acetyltransferase [Syntrophorhabdus sp.]|nr:GNAT family N-acetyltransferase [Syntrophorhabdus sp.]
MIGDKTHLESLKQQYPEKFVSEKNIFKHIQAGDRIFIGTACGEPQYLSKALIRYVESNPKALLDAEVLHIWSLGVAPYTDTRFKRNFRQSAFFIGEYAREAINRGEGDYSPIFLSQVPRLIRRGMIPIDVALIQTTPPDQHGFMSLGVSVDIIKAAVAKASLVIAQINNRMPRVHGDTFLHINDISFIIPHNEPLLEYETTVPSDVAERIGKYVASIVEDGDTIQVGYGSTPNAIIAALSNKHNLGVHTELFSHGIADLMKQGVVNNTKKRIDHSKTVAAFCMGNKETYEFIHDNPAVEFRTIDYTNNPAVIAALGNITAINSALEIDLTGQATAESIGKTFYSGIGGHTDFMRGAVLTPNGKSVLVLQSTAQNGTVSRIVPYLREGAGVTLTRGDVHYVVTEFGIAYLHGKNIRERAMALIAIANPKFQPWLIEEAKKQALIYKDQAFICGKGGEYPEELELYKTTRSGLKILLRPVRISDEPLLKNFYYSLSESTVYKRFMSPRKDMPHEKLQQFFVVIDYTKEMVMLAILKQKDQEVVAGVGQYRGHEESHSAEVAVMVKDEYQNQGIGTELLEHLTIIARKQGLLGFSAEVLKENRIMMHLFEKMGFVIKKEVLPDAYTLRLGFQEN